MTIWKYVENTEIFLFEERVREGSIIRYEAGSIVVPTDFPIPEEVLDHLTAGFRDSYCIPATESELSWYNKQKGI